MKWLASRINSLKKAEIEKNITPHSFRHSQTSLLIEAGVGIKEIQQRLGHTDINTTMNIYAHMSQYGRKGLPTV
jgi:integrase